MYRQRARAFPRFAIGTERKFDLRLAFINRERLVGELKCFLLSAGIDGLAHGYPFDAIGGCFRGDQVWKWRRGRVDVKAGRDRKRHDGIHKTVPRNGYLW